MAKLLDFGLVKPTQGGGLPVSTREGMVTGSPLYMAPEQVMQTHPADARTDIYAMGAIAYFLLTGQPPFVSGRHGGDGGPCSRSGRSAIAASPRSSRRPGESRASLPGKDYPESRFQDAQSLAESARRMRRCRRLVSRAGRALVASS